MSKDYKDTLNLPQTDFPMKANLSQREPEMLKAWDERQTYRKVQERNRERPFIFFTTARHMQTGTYTWAMPSIRY